MFMLAAFRPTVFIGTSTSTFSEVVLHLAFALSTIHGMEAVYDGKRCGLRGTSTLHSLYCITYIEPPVESIKSQIL